MAIFGGSQQTAQITTGNVRTTFDLFTATGAGIVNNNLKNALGTVYYDVTGKQGSPTSSIVTVTGQVNAPAVYKYVLYKSTTNPALVAAPAVVYWVDETFTTVSGDLVTDGFTGLAVDAAGYLMVNTTDLPNLTNTILNNSGNGSGVWICVGGFVKAAIVAASTAKGDMQYGTGQFATSRIAAHGTQTADKIIGIALTAISGSTSDIVVQPLNVT